MYAVIATGGKQHRVAEGDVIEVERLGASDGESVQLRPVLVVDGDTVLSTPDALGSAAVTARVVGATKGPKINGFVYKNNLEAAEEIARQLRLRDIGGIIVIDFIDMEVKKNRDDVGRVLREALSRDKTRTQVFDISELGLVEMTRKRIGEGLLVGFTEECEVCRGRGVVLDEDLLGS